MSNESNLQALEVQALWFENLVLVLLGIGLVFYFIKVGPGAFFEKMLEIGE